MDHLLLCATEASSLWVQNYYFFNVFWCAEIIVISCNSHMEFFTNHLEFDLFANVPSMI